MLRNKSNEQDGFRHLLDKNYTKQFVRQSPEVNFVKDLVAEGYIGKVRSCHMKVFTTAKGGTTNEASKYLLNHSNGGNPTYS